MSEPRNERLTIRKTNEEVLRKRLEVQARDLCTEEIKSFVECAKYQGLLVVFNCRKENYASKLFDNLYHLLLYHLSYHVDKLLILFVLRYSSFFRYSEPMYGSALH